VKKFWFCFFFVMQGYSANKLKIKIKGLRAKINHRIDIMNATKNTPWYFIDKMMEEREKLAQLEEKLIIVNKSLEDLKKWEV